MGDQIISNCLKTMFFLNSGKGECAKLIHANSACVGELSSVVYVKLSARAVCCCNAGLRVGQKPQLPILTQLQPLLPHMPRCMHHMSSLAETTIRQVAYVGELM